MSWTNPKQWVVGEMGTAALLNVHWSDNLTALGAHAQTGAAGDGASNLTSLDEIDWDHQATLDAPAAGHARMWIESGGTVRTRNFGGSEITLSTTDHSH